MSAFRKTRYVAAASVLACGSGFGLPAAAVSTTLAASQDSSSCTQNNVGAYSNQAATPWEIQGSGANTGLLKDAEGDSLDGTGVDVAVIDTGIERQKQLSVGDGKVLNGEDSSGYYSDDDGHGTMVASIIAAKKEAGVNGMQGIAPGVTLISMREAGCNAPGGNTEGSMATAINEAVGKGAEVINISQDGYEDDPGLRSAVANAVAQGVVIVTSAGNQGDRDTTDSESGKDLGVNPRTYPASYKGVLAVGAVDQYGTLATFSETGSAANSYYIGVVAPGVQVAGLMPNGKIATDDGTSFASPYVAAEAALIIQAHDWEGSSYANPSRAYEVIKIIEATADGDGAYSASMGWGVADIQQAVQADVPHSLVAPNTPISGLTPMLGVGPNADGSAVTTGTAASRTVVTPYVADAANHDAQNQQRWAYIALAAGLLMAIVALAGRAVARDTARRRDAAQL